MQLFWSDSDALVQAREVELGIAGSARKRFVVESARPAAKAWLVKFAGVDDRDAAQALVGAVVSVDRGVLGGLEDGEFYLADLIGARVVAPDGEVGEVVEIRSHPTLDCLVIRVADGTLVEQPLTEPWVESIDVEARRVTLASRDGMIV